MAQWDTPSPTLLPLILRYISVALFAAIAPVLTRFSETNFRR